MKRKSILVPDAMVVIQFTTNKIFPLEKDMSQISRLKASEAIMKLLAEKFDFNAQRPSISASPLSKIL